jgi:hypothetical protein
MINHLSKMVESNKMAMAKKRYSIRKSWKSRGKTTLLQEERVIHECCGKCISKEIFGKWYGSRCRAISQKRKK